jgi:hypothetical protein
MSLIEWIASDQITSADCIAFFSAVIIFTLAFIVGDSLD